MARRGVALYADRRHASSARNAGPLPARSALVTGFVVACLILATLEVIELATGHAGFGISAAVLIEIALIWRRCRSHAPTKPGIEKGTFEYRCWTVWRLAHQD